MSKFSSTEAGNIVAFAEILRGVHVRLLMEGYAIENGRITPPKLKSSSK